MKDKHTKRLFDTCLQWIKKHFGGFELSTRRKKNDVGDFKKATKEEIYTVI